MVCVIDDLTKIFLLGEHYHPKGQQLETKGARRCAGLKKMRHKPVKWLFDG
jgi:hypothetical protein